MCPDKACRLGGSKVRRSVVREANREGPPLEGDSPPKVGVRGVEAEGGIPSSEDPRAPVRQFPSWPIW